MRTNYTVFITLVLFFDLFAQETVFENPVPMHIGNTYQYVYIRYDDRNFYRIYDLRTVEITEEKIVNGKKYFKHPLINEWGFVPWVRYDSDSSKLYVLHGETELVKMDFNLSPGDSFKVYMSDGDYYNAKCTGGKRNIFGEEKNWLGYNFVFGPGDHYEWEECGFVDGYGVREEYTSIILYDDEGNREYYEYDDSPVIKMKPVTSTKLDYFELKCLIDHRFNRVEDPTHFSASECNFIDIAEMEYYYEKNGLREGAGKKAGERLPWTWEYRFKPELDWELIDDGYSFHYRIVATDKTLKPHTSYAPEEGYIRLEFDTVSVPLGNMFPLAVGNTWYYSKQNAGRSRFDTLKVTGETTAFGKQYYYLDPWDTWLRYDVDNNRLIRLVNRIEKTGVEFDKYYGELYSSFFNSPLRERLCEYVDSSLVIGDSTLYAEGIRSKKNYEFYSENYTYLFSEDIGPVFINIVGGSNSELVQAVLYDSLAKQPAVIDFTPEPVAEPDSINLGENNILSIEMNVSHEFTHFENREDYSFIKSCRMETEYRKEGEETIEGVIYGIRQEYNYHHDSSNATKFLFVDSLDSDLLTAGYDYLFRFTVWDKAYISNKSVHPVNEWYKVTKEGNIITVVSEPDSIKNTNEKVTGYALLQNFPNPFNPYTTIGYSLPEEADVKIVIFDILGRKIMTYREGVKKSGNYEIGFRGNGLSSGIYFYSINAKGTSGKTYSKTRKMVYMK